jgi:hypothetical protein
MIRPAMPRFFALGLLVIGVTMVAVALRQSTRARETRGWTRTEGRIVESRVEKIEDESEEHLDRTRFVIRYAYRVGGRTYESPQVWIGSSEASSSDEPTRWVERFPPGAVVPVWFDPRDPSQAVLVRGSSGRQLKLVLLVGAALAVVGFLVLARGGFR